MRSQRLPLVLIVLMVAVVAWWMAASDAPLESPAVADNGAAEGDVPSGAGAFDLESTSSEPVADGEIERTRLDGTGEVEQQASADAVERAEGHTLEVRVIGPDGGGVAGATVEAWSLGRSGQPDGWAVPGRATDAEGYVSFERAGGAPEGFVVRADAEGLASTAMYFSVDDDERTEVTFELRVAATLRGVLLDADGLPMSGGAELRLVRTDADGVPVVKDWWMLADAQGHFRVAWSGPGGPYTVAAKRAGYPWTKEVRVELFAGEASEEIELRMPSGIVQRGRVVLPDGTPLGVRNVSVSARPVWQGGEPPEESRRVLTEVDEAGRFAFHGLEPGPHVLTTFWRGEALAGAQSLPIEIGGAPIELVAQVCWLLLTPRDADGRPVRIKSLTSSPAAEPGEGYLRRAAVRTMAPPLDQLIEPGVSMQYHGEDEAGRDFQLIVPDDLAPGRYEFDLLESAGGFGTLRVVFEGGELPVPSRVNLNLANLEHGFPARHTLDLEAGATEIAWSGPPAGVYRLLTSIRRVNGGPDFLADVVADPDPIEVRAGEETVVTVQVEPRGRLRLVPRVVGAGQSDRVQCELRPMGKEAWRSPILEQELPDEDGELDLTYSSGIRLDHEAQTLDRLAPGVYELRFTGDGFHPYEITARVVGGEVVPVELRMERVD